MAARPRVDRADVEAREQRMQRSVCAPDLVGEHVRAAVVEQHEVELLRPVALVHAGPERRVRVHPLGRRRARQQLEEDLEVGERGTTFSIPMIVISVSGSVVHMRPLPSDSTTQTVPVSATAKFAPLMPTRARRKRSRR